MSNRRNRLEVRSHGGHVGIGNLAKVRKGHRRSDDASIRPLSFANRGGDLDLRPAADSRFGVGSDIRSHPPTEDWIVEAVASREVHARQVYLSSLLELLQRVTVPADSDGLHEIAAAFQSICSGLRNAHAETTSASAHKAGALRNQRREEESLSMERPSLHQRIVSMMLPSG